MAEHFDESELLSRVDNDTAFLAESVQMLIADTPAMLEDLRRALAAGDAPTVARHAHTIKGMVSNFCAAPAQDCALAIERMGKSANLSGAAPAVEELQEHLSALTDELARFVQSRT